MKRKLGQIIAIVAALTGCLGCSKPNTQSTEIVVALCQCRGTSTQPIDDAVRFVLGTNIPTPYTITLTDGNARSIAQASVPALVKDTAKARAESMRTALVEIEAQCRRNPRRSCPAGIDLGAVDRVVEDLSKRSDRLMLLLIGPIAGNFDGPHNAALAAVPTWWLDTSGATSGPDSPGRAALARSGLNVVATSTDSRLFYSGLAQDLKAGNPWVADARHVHAANTTAGGGSVLAGATPAPPVLQVSAPQSRLPLAKPQPAQVAVGSQGSVGRHSNRPIGSTSSDEADRTATESSPEVSQGQTMEESGYMHKDQGRTNADRDRDSDDSLSVEDATLQSVKSRFRKGVENSPLPTDFVGIFFDDGVGANSLELHLNAAEKQSHTIPGSDCSTAHVTWRIVGRGIEQVFDARGIAPDSVASALVTVSRRLSGPNSMLPYTVRVLASVSGREYARTLRIEKGQSPTISLTSVLR